MKSTYIPMLFSFCSLFISVAAIVTTVRFWHRTNRPIVSARITTAHGGNNAIALNIVIENTGNRPAKNIKLIADRAFILKSMKESSSREVPLDARRCFYENKIIPVLANGKVASNAFGAIGNDGNWEAGAKIPICIEYLSFEGKRYSEKMDLWLVDDAGFAQTFWDASPNH